MSEEWVGAGGYFKTLVVDPPWKFRDKGVRGAAEHHYKTMTIEETLELPMGDLVGNDGHFWLWTPNVPLKNGWHLPFFQKWGFEPKTIYTWCKPQIGTGHYLRNNTEHIVFGTRGRLPVLRRNQGTWGVFPRSKKHSQKPPGIYKMIASMSPGPRADMFSRGEIEGIPASVFLSWGDECQEPNIKLVGGKWCRVIKSKSERELEADKEKVECS